jgi:hypothetical protein
MNCKKAKETLSALMDGELDAREEKALGEHIASCGACRALLREYEASWDALGKWEGVEPEPGYVSRFWTKATSGLSWLERISQGIRVTLAHRKVAYATIVTICLIAAFHVSFNKYVNELKTRALLVNMSQEEWEMMENYDIISELGALEDIEVRR